MVICNEVAFQFGVQKEDTDGVHMVIDGMKWLCSFINIGKLQAQGTSDLSRWVSNWGGVGGNTHWTNRTIEVSLMLVQNSIEKAHQRKPPLYSSWEKCLMTSCNWPIIDESKLNS